jgi:hypothetical protein
MGAATAHGPPVAFCAGTKCQILTTSSARRKETQRRFNMDPAKDPLRILLATDAAREGLSFQAHCADLFHFDTYALGRSNPSVQLARRKKSFKLNIRQKSNHLPRSRDALLSAGNHWRSLGKRGN